MYWNKQAFEAEFGEIGNPRKKNATNTRPMIEFSKTQMGKKEKFSLIKILQVFSRLEEISQTSFITEAILDRESRKLTSAEFDLLMKKISNNHKINFILR